MTSATLVPAPVHAAHTAAANPTGAMMRRAVRLAVRGTSRATSVTVQPVQSRTATVHRTSWDRPAKASVSAGPMANGRTSQVARAGHGRRSGTS